MNEIRGLRLKLADLIREQQILRAGVENVEVLKKEVHHLGRQVLQERTKVKALSDELENPLNIHRCDLSSLLYYHPLSGGCLWPQLAG